MDFRASIIGWRTSVLAIVVGLAIGCPSPTLAWTEPVVREPKDGSPSSIDWKGAHAERSRLIESSLRSQYRALWDGMSNDAKAGYRHLTESIYLPADFDEQVLEKIDAQDFRWPLRDQQLPIDARQRTWTRFGLAPRPDDPNKPLQYIPGPDGGYVMNCFACHGGSLFGATYPGAPNTLYALESLTEQVRRTKLSLKKELGHMDIGSMAMPLGTTVGTSNAVMFGVALMNFRDADLRVHTERTPAPLVNHDMDAPPWWHFHRKHHIYIEGFAQKGHRGLMQFMLVKQNGPEQFRGWEDDFRKVYAFLSELRAPKYPGPVDSVHVEKGRVVFEEHCARCHGTYGTDGEYPELRIPIDELGTDSVRLKSLSLKHRKSYGDSWFADYGKQETILEADGYVAPPLDGVWATAPYFHNGSVPTLWHVLNPEARPAVWTRVRLGLDEERMGLDVEELNSIPSGTNKSDRRWYYDTRDLGKSSDGHDYPAILTDQQKVELLEYLKTL